jgi:aryl-alcohol dehydrogenase-like predicted oxidoreductase
MRYRLLSRRAGLRVFELALCTGKFGHAVEETDAIAVLGVYADTGGRFLDTAAGYQNGAAEEIVGRFVADRRDDFVIGTKYGTGVHRGELFTARGNNRKAMVASVEASLRRLGTDYIDLLWTHGYDPHVPLKEVLLAFGHLVAASVRDRAVQVRRPRIAGCDGRRPVSGGEGQRRGHHGASCVSPCELFIT